MVLLSTAWVLRSFVPARLLYEQLTLVCRVCFVCNRVQHCVLELHVLAQVLL
jgi:hypothetical protein